MIKNKQYLSIKSLMEDVLFFVCKENHLNQYINNNKLAKGYSLTGPYEDIELLIDFHNIISDILENPKTKYYRNSLYNLQNLSESLVKENIEKDIITDEIANYSCSSLKALHNLCIEKNLCNKDLLNKISDNIVRQEKLMEQFFNEY